MQILAHPITSKAALGLPFRALGPTELWIQRSRNPTNRLNKAKAFHSTLQESSLHGRPYVAYSQAVTYSSYPRLCPSEAMARYSRRFSRLEFVSRAFGLGQQGRADAFGPLW